MLAENLKKARKSKGLSQEEVAEKLNTSRQSVSKWENGWSTPDINQLARLSTLYDVELGHLVNGTSTETISSTQSPSEQKRKNFSSLEKFFLIACLAVTCNVPIIGTLLCIGVCLYNRKTFHSNLLYIVCVICLMINIHNMIITANQLFFHVGSSNVQKIN